MCPACLCGAHGRWPLWVSAGRGLIKSSGSKTLLFSRLVRPIGATDYSITLENVAERHPSRGQSPGSVTSTCKPTSTNTFRFNRRFYPFNAFRSLLGIAGDVTAPTYAELYSGAWQHPTCWGCG